MSRAPEAELRPLSEAEVAEYLFRHPDFLSQHPELLAVLAVPERTIDGADSRGGEVIDLHQAMLARLRAELGRSQRREGALIANSRSNLHTASRIHAAVLAVLGARGLQHLVDIVTTDLAVLLDVDIAGLCLERGALGRAGTVAVPGGLRASLVADGTVDGLIGAGNDVVLRSHIAGSARIYGSGAGLVRSEALIRLHVGPQPPQALLAFGSRVPDMFDASQGTELIGFLGRVLEHTLREWLARTD